MSGDTGRGRVSPASVPASLQKVFVAYTLIPAIPAGLPATIAEAVRVAST
jgi:hypothetical protein